MSGLPQPLAVRLHLPYLLAYLVDPCHMNSVVTVVCALFMSIAIFVFAVALGARPITAVIARQIAAVEFFPPLRVFLLPWTKFRTTNLALASKSNATRQPQKQFSSCITQ
jgi:hypothetical protein